MRASEWSGVVLRPRSGSTVSELEASVVFGSGTRPGPTIRVTGAQLNGVATPAGSSSVSFAEPTADSASTPASTPASTASASSPASSAHRRSLAVLLPMRPLFIPRSAPRTFVDFPVVIPAVRKMMQSAPAGFAAPSRDAPFPDVREEAEAWTSFFRNDPAAALVAALLRLTNHKGQRLGQAFLHHSPDCIEAFLATGFVHGWTWTDDFGVPLSVAEGVRAIHSVRAGDSMTSGEANLANPSGLLSAPPSASSSSPSPSSSSSSSSSSSTSSSGVSEGAERLLWNLRVLATDDRAHLALVTRVVLQLAEMVADRAELAAGRGTEVGWTGREEVAEILDILAWIFDLATLLRRQVADQRREMPWMAIVQRWARNGLRERLRAGNDPTGALDAGGDPACAAAASVVPGWERPAAHALEDVRRLDLAVAALRPEGLAVTVSVGHNGPWNVNEHAKLLQALEELGWCAPQPIQFANER